MSFDLCDVNRECLLSDHEVFSKWYKQRLGYENITLQQAAVFLTWRSLHNKMATAAQIDTLESLSKETSISLLSF